ncbi:MAG: efflux RND transporter periplasmic adaptor subunit [Patescibacteria group bacterium]|nr:efflux RND transporter periplasmic adaptor subunit [Patescibacteria group bacterium]
MKKYIVASVAVLVVLSGISYYTFKSGNAKYATATVERGSITQEVSASGNVAAPSTINLQFQNAGKLTSIGVQIGDKVSAGNVIARQDTSVLGAQLQQAQAAVDAEQAQLASLQQGTRPEQVAVAQAQVSSDQSALTQANLSIINAIQSAYTASDDAVHNKVDQFLSNARTSSPQLSLTTADSQISNTFLSERVSIEGTLAKWQAGTANLVTAGNNVFTAETEAQTDLTLVTQLLSDANAVLNSAVPTTNANQTSINGWISNVATARTNVNAAASSLTTSITTQQSDTATLDKDRKSLALEQAGSTGASVAAQQAKVAQAQANVAAIQAQIAQMSLVAPVSGTVTQVNGDVGETVSPATIVVSIIPNAKLQTNVNLSEDNVANVKVGNPVTISLDAFPGMQWQGTVAKVDPAQTIIGGAVYYKTTVVFNQSDARIKSGMTANVLIQTGAASSTLLVPASAIQTNGMSTHVQLDQNGKITNQNVTTGLKSQDGMVEITSGLSEGESVVTGPK